MCVSICTEMECTSMEEQTFFAFNLNRFTAYLNVLVTDRDQCTNESCRILSGGAKFLSLNEKQRGFPTGLRVMASHRYDFCLLEVKPSLEEAQVNGGEWMQVVLVEVWGCGGREAQQTQQRIREWESKQVLRRREVITTSLISRWLPALDF